MPLLWGLQLPTAKKLATTFVFGIGLVICLIAGIRLKYSLALDYNDFTYSINDIAILGPLEPMLGIISACLPMIPPVVAKFSKNKWLLAWRTKGDSDALGKQSESRRFGSQAIRTIGSSAPKRAFENSVLDADGYDELDDGNYPLVEYAARGGPPRGGGNKITCTTEVMVDSKVIPVEAQV